MQQIRWFPKEGDLVAVPLELTTVPGLRPRCCYGIVVRESDSDFPGVWWKIYYSGKIEEMHIHVIRPLCDSEGKWLQRKSLSVQ